MIEEIKGYPLFFRINYFYFMFKNLILCDAGGSKSSWAFIENNRIALHESDGLNPNYLSDEEWLARLPAWPYSSPADAVFFFGAGLGKGEQNKRVELLLESKYACEKIRTDNDLMAACLATAGEVAGIVCILGTGANACIYNGKEITHTVPAPGYILGDEGGGTWIGKQLLIDYIHKELPGEIFEFIQDSGLTYEKIVKQLYQGKLPGKWLASQIRLLDNFVTHAYTRELVGRGFNAFETAFLKRLSPDRSLPVHVVGGIAYNFREEWEHFLEKKHYIKGHVYHKPMDSLIKSLHLFR
jgi:glucosamine kinase